MFFFEENSNLVFKPISVESAYLLIVNDDLDAALGIFETIDSPRAKWGICLVGILKGYTEKLPTYFEIRNFLEIDLDYLLKNNKIDYVESLIGALDFFVSINPEAYKFVARVMFENNLPNAGKKYLDKAKSIYYNDPELHFMYAKHFFNTNEYNLANYHISECLKILPDYFPAKKLHAKINQNL